MTDTPAHLTGRCLCGSVRFSIDAPFRPIMVCHCRQCARWTGSTVPATAVSPDRFHLAAGADKDLGWFRASDTAGRGFCKVCGSSLFWKPDNGRHISILAGSLDPPTGLAVDSHIFVADKSDYVSIAEDVPCYAQYTDSPIVPQTGRTR